MQSLGFQLVDTALSFECPMPLSGADAGRAQARMAKPADEEVIARIARDAFTHDRFHADPNISKKAADGIKEAWTRNYFAGKRGKWMVAGEVEDEVAGFLLLLETDSRLIIDLIAVAEKRRGFGVGHAMISFAAKALPQFKAMLVSTQVSNVTSVRFYESLGFRLTGAQYVLHCHR